MTNKQPKQKKEKKMNQSLKKAREKSTLGTGNLLAEIVVFLQGHKKSASPVVIAEAISVKNRKVRNTMQKRLSLADGKKAQINAGIVEVPKAYGGGFVRLTKVTPTASDSSRNRYEWKRTIPKSWLS